MKKNLIELLPFFVIVLTDINARISLAYNTNILVDLVIMIASIKVLDLWHEQKNKYKKIDNGEI